MENILLLDTGTQGYVSANSIKKAGYKVFLLFKGKHNYADDSKHVYKKFETEFNYEDPQYLNVVKKIIKDNKIDVIIPMSDLSSRFLSKNKKQLSHIVKYILPDIEIFEKGYDKNLLMSTCSQNGYPHPYTINNVKNIENINQQDLFFPLLIKPNHTCGGRGMTLVKDYKELKRKFPEIYKQYGDCHLQEYIPSGGAQVEVQIFINKKQELVASSVIYKYRWYPENGGSSCCATSIKNDDIVTTCFNLLKDIGWVGFADFDLIEDPRDGNLKIMELNPRMPACVKAAVVSGIDWPTLIVEEYLNKPHKEFTFKPGIILKHLGMECLWFLYSKNRFNTKPFIGNIFNKKIYFQDLDWKDPIPFLKGSWHNFKKQLNPSFRKSKAGTR